MAADRFGMKARVPASTANLGAGFDVVGLGLQMYLEVEVQPGGTSLVIENFGRGADQMPVDESNLIYRMIAEHAGDDLPQGLRMRVNNDIPLTRGLGSSAAATVAGVAIGMWLKNGTPPEKQPVLEAATRVEGHPDNASAAVLGGLTVSAMIEGQVAATSLRVPYDVQLVVIIPEVELSTRMARKVIPLSIPRAEAVFNLQRLGMLLAGLYQNNKDFLFHGVGDQIHQKRRVSLLPPMGAVMNLLNDLRDCKGAFISGAGPSIAAFTVDEGERLGQLGVEEFGRHGIESTYSVLAPDYIGLTF